jgi:hypothetical protein
MSAFLAWRRLEPRRGDFLFKTRTAGGQLTPNDLTNVLNAAREAGLRVILRLDDPPDWACGKVYCLAPADVESIVYEMVSYGRGQIAYVEVFNEPNLPGFWGTSPADPAAYVRILEGAARGARRADPNVKVIAAAVAQRTGGIRGTMEDVEWLQRFYEAGARAHFDVLGMRAYLGSYDPETALSNCVPVPLCFRNIELYRAVMEANGDGGKPAMITEMGALEQTATGLGDFDWMKLSPERRADYLVKALQIASRDYPWLLGATIFNLDYAAVTRPEEPPYWFSLLDDKNSPRLAYNRIRDARASGALP